MGKFPKPHLFKITNQSKPIYKVWPSKGEGTENATACDSTHAAPPQASTAEEQIQLKMATSMERVCTTPIKLFFKYPICRQSKARAAHAS